MPKTIDHEQRKADVAAAVWRLIVSSGVSAVSLRTVAAEAGIVLGSLRHSFPTKADLLAYSMQLVHANVEKRVATHTSIQDPHALVTGILLELLPVDDQRYTEMRVNVALIAEAPAHPRLAELAEAAQTAIADLCLQLCRYLAETAHLHPTRDPGTEARRLHALIDGMALHILVTPSAAAATEAALSTYLKDLAAPSR
ncbi:TetR family transcriptional regulator [Nocardia uniformis]|uniref:TetR family transcriptional regulator n=1 Tax=Nocardia uniformis TaxID=53432 RepID=A0A849C420_9NOCA|nr:TetR family transcriptional regulator C-terminal domain-containing protein [Nocardia uniformis]NNH70517.1 TetR family transcriptional regulator [Nocardia uniformis]